MVRGTISKLLFVDSSVNTDGRDHTKLTLPTHPFSCQGNERMAITLVSFTMRRNWLNINATNNTFYIFVAGTTAGTGTYHEVVIPPGVYPNFALLKAAIQQVATEVVSTIAEITTVSVLHDAVTRKFEFTFTAVQSNTKVFIRCFALKSGAAPDGVTLKGRFNDSFEILGAKPVRNVLDVLDAGLNSHTFSSLNPTQGNIHKFGGFFPATLNTLDAVYLRTNFETGNYMSTGFDAYVVDSLAAIESSIFARIPFDDSTFTEAHEVISFEDSGGDMYQSFLQRKSLDSLDSRVTDSKGRSLSTLDPTQAELGLMAFKLCVRLDTFIPPSQPEKAHSLKFEHPPNPGPIPKETNFC